MINWLLLFFPIAIGLEYQWPERHLLIFVTSCLAILPLASWLGRATEQLAERLGEGVGGLLNATFGNAAKLTITLAALRAGLHDVVMASLAGLSSGTFCWCSAPQCWQVFAIVNNASMRQALVPSDDAPACGDRPHCSGGLSSRSRYNGRGIGWLSVSISVALLIVYFALSCIRTDPTHPTLFAGTNMPESGKAHASIGRAGAMLAIASAGIASMLRSWWGRSSPRRTNWASAIFS